MVGMLGQDVALPHGPGQPVASAQLPQVQANNTEAPPVKVQPPEDIVIDDKVKGMFLSVENAGKPTSNYLALENSTFKDLKKRGKLRYDVKWQDMTDPTVYDEVATGYIRDLQETFNIPTIQEAVLWSYRPGYYAKYGGDIEKIPDDKKGSFGKSAKDVMRQRKHWLDKYLKEQQDA